MKKNDEFLLTVLSGFLLAFGIYDPSTKRVPDSFTNSCESNLNDISKYWEEVGGYIRKAQVIEQSSGE